ncbi:hypothetical protein TI04_08430 [Achromatium sp. WMS2]|nr:hypothetical protein TI04_08430 [Achromatium sp. WMS2]
MIGRIAIEASCGNVFADLGYSNPEEAVVKSRLMQRIQELIVEQNLTPAQTAVLLGLDKLHTSRLLRGSLREFTTERLFKFLNGLNQDVEIVIKQKPATRQRAVLSVIPV